MLIGLLIQVQLGNARGTLKILVTLRHQMEIFFYRRLDSNIQGTKTSHVEVHLHNFLLGVLLCQTNCQCSFGNLTIDRLLVVPCQIFDYLLGESTTASLDRVIMLKIGKGGTGNALWIDTGVGPEGVILASNHRILHHLW